MGAFSTVLLAILLIFAAGLIKLVIALILLVLAAQGIRNVRSVLQKGAFFAAVEHSNADKIERCLMRGANLNEVKTFTVNYYRRIHTLSYTCYLNKADSARQLIAHGADVNQDTGLNSPTPLMYACQNNNAALAALLIARGADVDKAHFVPKRLFSCTSVWRQMLASPLVEKRRRHGYRGVRIQRCADLYVN